jgi:hypothetical protein
MLTISEHAEWADEETLTRAIDEHQRLWLGCGDFDMQRCALFVGRALVGARASMGRLRAEVERLTAERDAARAVVEDVDAALDHGIDDADDGLWPCGSTRGKAIRKLRAEVERLACERDSLVESHDNLLGRLAKVRVARDEARAEVGLLTCERDEARAEIALREEEGGDHA